jgi:hypothetical protein
MQNWSLVATDPTIVSSVMFLEALLAKGHTLHPLTYALQHMLHVHGTCTCTLCGIISHLLAVVASGI